MIAGVVPKTTRRLAPDADRPRMLDHHKVCFFSTTTSMTARQDAPPPEYNPLDSVASDSELPAYRAQERPAVASPNPPPISSAGDTNYIEFPYEMTNSWGKQWATLLLLAHPKSSRIAPTFIEGSDIAGSVSFNIRSPDPIKSVVVSIKGNLVVAGEQDKRLNFVQLRRTLWSTSMGDPRAPRTTGSEWAGKLHGQYRWPFSINTQELAAGMEEQFRLPHTFTKRLSLEPTLRIISNYRSLEVNFEPTTNWLPILRISQCNNPTHRHLCGSLRTKTTRIFLVHTRTPMAGRLWSPSEFAERYLGTVQLTPNAPCFSQNHSVTLVVPLFPAP
ncbi:hypothetical protein C8R46DRAFT_43880 [Mycena filopes]|nr:hypothetical protein C8R46DRAFT_43880 [Mycena filopes]